VLKTDLGRVAVAVLTLCTCAFSTLAQAPNPTDDRFKADLLVVVAHPDDETIIGSYLARAIFDQHKRVAVIFGTRGNSGGDEVGPQQAASLGAIREIEGRRALAYFGVMNVWFLDGLDTPGQDVLRSLETWDHGKSLGQVVRIVRLTRPEVIATWLPAYSAGENHGDHQTAGVLATEAFDTAGDPTQYPEQVAAPRDPGGISNLTEGLHPWQPQKLYYFTDASHTEFMDGKGPQYSAHDRSPSKHVSYARLAAEECSFHLTQSDSGYAAKIALENNQVEKTYLQDPARFLLGKSLVETKAASDLFDNVRTKALGYVRPPGYTPSEHTEVTLELGGPWRYYHAFWNTHGLDPLQNLLPPEVLAGTGTTVTLPLLITNPTSRIIEGAIKVDLPEGWSLRPAASSFRVASGEVFSSNVVALAPPAVSKNWKTIRIRATAGQRTIGEIAVRVQVGSYSLPQ
jgi:LmbE family N-acetylglucosaminyl deacetylase